MNADVVGYSRLMADDEADTIRAVAACGAKVEQRIAAHRGRLAEFVGDNFLAEFPSATDAVECALAIQRTLRADNAGLPPDRWLELRIGVHLGEVRADGGHIFGSGVNVAARLQALAQPGRICISSAVREQVRGTLELRSDDLGEQRLKNIPDAIHVYELRTDESAPGEKSRAHPVLRRRRRVRRILVSAIGLLLALVGGTWVTWPLALGVVVELAGLGGPPRNPALPDRPSIVVLPLANLSDDPEQEYLSDGITEDLTTDLARFPFLFVIARDSAFTYKDAPPDLARVHRELGVRYVLQGSVQRLAGRVRITVRLTDTTTGIVVWTERYDRELSDIFTLQQDIAQEILTAVGLTIADAEVERVRRLAPGNLNAYDLFQKARFHFNRFTRAHNAEARGLLERAVALDPSLTEAHALLGATYTTEFVFGWNRDAALLDAALGRIEQALSLEPSNPIPQVALSAVRLAQQRPEAAAEAAQRAIDVAPGFASPHFFLGSAQAQQGKLVAAMASIKHALRLNPRAATAWWLPVAYVNLAAGRSNEAVAMLERVRGANPELIPARIPLAALYESEGRHHEAGVVVAEILRVNPAFTAELAADSTVGRLFGPELPAILRRAGLP